MVDVYVGEYSLAGIQLDSVEPSTVEDDGGYEITLRGLFKDETAKVYLKQGATLYECYSAKSGQGYDPRPRNPVTMIVATPPVPRGVYDVRVVQGLDDDELAAALTVVARNWKSRVFDLRRLLPPWYKTGPRKLDSVDLLTP